VNLKTQRAEIFEEVLATRDRYGLHAYLTALENTSQTKDLEDAIKSSAVGQQRKNQLLDLLHTSRLGAEPLPLGLALTQAASQS
jgi:hypothetical protein